MKLRLTTWPVPNPSNHYWPIPLHTLHAPCRSCIQLGSPHYTRRQLRLTFTQPSCKRGILILHLPVPSRRTRNLLRLLLLPRNMKSRCSYSYYNHRNSLYGLRPSLGTNKILGRYCHHKPSLSHPLRRSDSRRMIMRRFRRRQCNTQPILRPTFSTSICHRRSLYTPLIIPPSNGLQQPTRRILKYR